MLITIKFNLLLQAAALGGYLLFLGATYAQASPMTRLDDFHPNCDVRPLGLSYAQTNELRSIRKEYKKAIEKALRKDERVNKNRRRDIIKILSSDKFNADDARDYVENRYLSGMEFAVDELSIQHRFYKLLTPSQRQYWLNACLR
ncbi:Spy/CpxP family protein refolding chaperone [Neisseria dentiae]|uniref:Spy/CpxP family protein refolding chaperone n=1 Tax=Neisseria dentiae TaxID=194197 RepID=UPI0035A112C5